MSSTTADKLNYLKGTKEAIKNAIVSKGVEVEEDATFRSYAEKIESIEVGDMTKAVYDPTGRNTDIFAYAEGLLGRGIIKGIQNGIIKRADSQGNDAELVIGSGVVSYVDITISSVNTQKSIAIICKPSDSGDGYESGWRFINSNTLRLYSNRSTGLFNIIWKVIEFC